MSINLPNPLPISGQLEKQNPVSSTPPKMQRILQAYCDASHKALDKSTIDKLIEQCKSFSIKEVLVKCVPLPANSLSLDSQLIMAVFGKDYKKVRQLIDQGADVNTKWEHQGYAFEHMLRLVGDTPLHLAAENGDEQMVDILLQHGARLANFSRAGATPALKAISIAVRSKIPHQNEIDLAASLYQKTSWLTDTHILSKCWYIDLL